MKRILLLGASGSIGTQTVDILKAHPEELTLVGASVGQNRKYLEMLLQEHSLACAYLREPDYELESRYPKTVFYFGADGLTRMVREADYDLLVNALVGFTGFRPTLTAIESGKDVALANKETLVAGGDLIMNAVKKYGVKLFPIDSEHSAILQCLQGHRKEDLRKLIITGSGGSFRDKSREELEGVTLKDALKHPVWSMGAKITIDSATMMNKGFEVMEAHHLFDVDYDKIDVILHAESIVHSMAEYNDGSIIAQLGVPDMHLAIKYALLYPEHKVDLKTKYLDLAEVGSLNFRKMDYRRYPLVKLAKDVGKYGGNFGSVLIGANDEAVSLFLHERISFTEIETYVFQTLEAARFIRDPGVEDILYSNRWAVEYVDRLWANS